MRARRGAALAVTAVLSVGCSSGESAEGLAEWCEVAAQIDSAFTGFERLGPGELIVGIDVLERAVAVAPDQVSEDVAVLLDAFESLDDLGLAGPVPESEIPEVIFTDSDVNERITAYNTARCVDGAVTTSTAPGDIDGAVTTTTAPVRIDDDVVVEPGQEPIEAVAAVIADSLGITIEEARCVAADLDVAGLTAGDQIDAAEIGAILDACGVDLSS